MSTLAAVVVTDEPCGNDGVLTCLAACPDVGPTALVAAADDVAFPGQHHVIRAAGPRGDTAMRRILDWFHSTQMSHLLWVMSPSCDLPAAGIHRLRSVAVDTGAALVYADYYDRHHDGSVALHPLIDYQPGSLRDDFEFGPVACLQGAALRELRESPEWAALQTQWGGWYALRLFLSEQGAVVRLPEPIATVDCGEKPAGEAAHFRYVDPRQRDYQVEMERLATDHLRRVNAYLPPPQATPVADTSPFPVEASVVVPVRNRERTIADAIRSALSQETQFPFNVIVIDNHSSDGTTRILRELAADDPRCIHLVPTRRDLGIGGCWNEAVYSPHCGRFAAQLDSDDLYSGPHVLSRIVAAFHQAPVAMVIGSYTIVDFDLQPMPPGLVDHREWSDENGHNNALRIAGLGAPGAFHVPTLRTIGFPNVSYGEDYAVALQLTARYRLGRIYDSLYWCRRWEDNTDHQLSLEMQNRYAAYKDRLRSIELARRQS